MIGGGGGEGRAWIFHCQPLNPFQGVAMGSCSQHRPAMKAVRECEEKGWFESFSPIDCNAASLYSIWGTYTRVSDGDRVICRDQYPHPTPHIPTLRFSWPLVTANLGRMVLAGHGGAIPVLTGSRGGDHESPVKVRRGVHEGSYYI